MSKNPYVYDTAVKSEMPPAFNYKIELATREEKTKIIEKLSSIGRQTMNFRTSGEKGFAIILRDIENNKIAGWQGLDISRMDLAEKFSLHLEPEYRKFLLGLVLELAFASYLKTMGVKYAYVRMDSTGNSSLVDWRLKQGLFVKMNRNEFDSDWIDRCQQCELLEKSCKTQIFIRMDVQKFIDFGRGRLNFSSDVKIPSQVCIEPSIVRYEARENEQKFTIRQVS